jgi:hypothetical protein
MAMTLREMKDIDVRTVDIESLVDGSEIQVDLDLPVPERMESTIKQMNGNPYFLRSGAIAVKISHADTAVTLDERMESYLRTL